MVCLFILPRCLFISIPSLLRPSKLFYSIYRLFAKFASVFRFFFLCGATLPIVPEPHTHKIMSALFDRILFHTEEAPKGWSSNLTS